MLSGLDVAIALGVLSVVLLGAWAGWRSGATRFALGLAGLVAGAVIGLALAGWLVGDRFGGLTRLALDAACVVGAGLVGASLGARVGDLLGRGLRRLHLGVLDRSAGAVLRAGAALAVCAVLAGAVLAFAPPTAALRTSAVVTRLAGVLPPVPVLARDLPAVRGALSRS